MMRSAGPDAISFDELDRPLIHWVSPLPPLPTDIAHYTRRILPSLAELADVVLWTHQDEWNDDLRDFAEVRRFDPLATHPMPLASLPSTSGTQGAIFFNIGNSWIFHQDIYALSRRVPGVVVIHDLVLQEFFRDMVHNKFLAPTSYIATMQRHYGEDARATAESVCACGQLTQDILERFPMFEGAIEHSVAALVHTEAGFDSIASRGFVPTYGLNLPFAVGLPVSARRSETGPLKLLQFGHIGPNRRLLQILEALGEVKDRMEFCFEICGSVWDRELVERRIEALGLSSRVRLRGFVSEPELDAAIAQAHLVFNLRFPTMGEASGSQLRIWNQAGLSVVSRVGWYATLPEECVVKISVENERRDLMDLLGSIASDRTRFLGRGESGRTMVECQHNTSAYAAGIVEIARRFRRDARDHLLMEAGIRMLRNQATDLMRSALRSTIVQSIFSNPKPAS
ncbi:hypothetical protein [Reyranella sp.]|uniref:hypothetical protein n=1 Tax=Reyranella sp. TaxID=1929291 RepID=UPI003D0FE895